MENWYSNGGCTDTLQFYADRTNGSLWDIPFGSCSFSKTEYDDSEVRKAGGDWKNFKDNPVYCSFSRAVKSLAKIWIKVCEKKGKSSSNSLRLEISNDDASLL